MGIVRWADFTDCGAGWSDGRIVRMVRGIVRNMKGDFPVGKSLRLRRGIVRSDDCEDCERGLSGGKIVRVVKRKFPVRGL